jgi:hypothetical protein
MANSEIGSKVAQATEILKITNSEAVFLVMSDPSMNEL